MTVKISVLMPVYNAAPYLREAIESILGQTFTDFEFIIVNDGSTDASGSIIDSYQDSRIKHVEKWANAGMVAALNDGIDLARGEYIARMDADDISLPGRLVRQAAFMDGHPDVGVCGTAYQYFGDLDRTEFPIQDPKRAFTFLSRNSSLGHPTTLIRRSVLNQHAIRYESEYGFAADYALWIRIGQFSRITSLPAPLVLYRWHASNMSKTDPDRANAVARARILWHQLMVGRTLDESEKFFFEKRIPDSKAFRASRNLFLTILEKQTHTAFDPAYYGKLAVTEWELKVIDHFGFRGLIASLFDHTFRRAGYPTVIGLVAYYLKRFGIRSAPSKKSD